MTLKALEITKANADGHFDFFKSFVGAKTLGDVIELQTAFARQQFETFSGQLANRQEATQKAALEVGGPARAALEKGLKQQKVA